MHRAVLVVAALASAFALNADSTAPAAGGKVVLVKMVDVSPTEYRFQPAEISVQPGDTLRFEQAGAMPHNVEFRDIPIGTDLGAARSSPYLTRSGERYDLVIDSRFATGVHNFVCTPHESLGMRGILTVAAQ